MFGHLPVSAEKKVFCTSYVKFGSLKNSLRDKMAPQIDVLIKQGGKREKYEKELC